MAEAVLYGPAYSAYTRIVRLILEEKGAPYRLEEVDFVAAGGMPKDQFDRHPFGKVPALVHDGITLFETLPIALYLEEALPGAALLPAGAPERARGLEAVACLDNYLWPDIRELVTQRLFAGLAGGWPDEKIVDRMTARLEAGLATFAEAFAKTFDGAPWLAGRTFTLADLHGVPMIDYLQMTPEGAGLLVKNTRLAEWWATVRERPSVVKTAVRLEDYPWAKADQF